MRTAFVVGILMLSSSIGAVESDLLLWIVGAIACVFWFISDIPDFMRGLSEIKNISKKKDRNSGIPFVNE